jgi:hypothetical protein
MTKAWHFVQNDRTLRYSGEKIRKGGVYRAEGPLELCHNGMHASVNPLDALRYAPGSIICRVEMRGEIIKGDDKLVARERKILWWADADRTLHEFAIWCAERALKAANVTDDRCWNALKVKRRWLDGGATDAELDTAWAAARAAAWAAARAAAWAAARDAEREAQSRELTRMLNALEAQNDQQTEAAI